MRYVFVRLAWVAAAVAIWTWSPLSFAEAAELRVATFRCDVTPPLGFLTYPPTFKPLEEIEHLYRGKGCDQCNGIGYFGRAPVFEVMPIRTEEMRGVITEAGTEDQVLRIARSEGFTVLKEEAIAMVNEGVTTLDEALKIIIME